MIFYCISKSCNQFGIIIPTKQQLIFTRQLLGLTLASHLAITSQSLEVWLTGTLTSGFRGSSMKSVHPLHLGDVCLNFNNTKTTPPGICENKKKFSHLTKLVVIALADALLMLSNNLLH